MYKPRRQAKSKRQSSSKSNQGQRQRQRHKTMEPNETFKGALGASGSASLSASFIVIALILSTIVVCTFVGNLFVIVAILVEKNLQTTANQLVLSLAVADLMVACLVMPLGAYNDIYQGWYLGTAVCEFWTSADVLCCTGEFGGGGRSS